MEQLNELFTKYMKNECTEEEIRFLLHHFNQAENETKLKDIITNGLKNNDPADQEQEDSTLDERIAKIYDRIRNKIEEENIQAPRPYLTNWYRLTAAAAILVLVSFGLYLFNYHQPVSQLTSNKPAAHKVKSVEDITPGSNRAILTLPDGSRIALHHAGNGVLANLGKAVIRKTSDGQLSYESGNHASGVEMLEFNTIAIPRGGQYKITLPDGTGVWLNAASSLKFPTSFTGEERRVELTGEAYFEVAKDVNMPFRVISAGQSIEVLGTHFNVNAYPDESVIKTTLLEGSVRITEDAEKKSVILKPGQQAKTNHGISVSEVDIEEAIAWKNGLISFKSADLKSIMRQVARWYDVTVYYSGNVPDRLFTGKISRYSNLSEILEVLAKNGIHFKIQGRTITMQP